MDETMQAIGTGDERREHKRFKLKDGSSFVLHSNWPDKGVLVDISKGGLSFQYNSETPWPEESDERCMVFGDHDSCLNSIPITVIADQLIHCGNENTMVVRRRNLKFGALDEHQKFLLECFIWINSTAQC